MALKGLVALGILMLCGGCSDDTGSGGSATGSAINAGGDEAAALPPTVAALRVDPGQMKQIADALKLHHDTHKRFPGASTDAAGRTGLSWRVHILPFLGEAALYNQFNPDEPWDSPANLQLVNRMPDVYRVSGIDDHKTSFHVFVGENTPFGQEQGVSYADVIDGNDNTMMVVTGTADTAVEWTKPGGLTFDPSDPYNGLAMVDGGYPFISMASITWQFLADKPDDLAAHVTHNGQETRPGGAIKPWGR